MSIRTKSLGSIPLKLFFQRNHWLWSLFPIENLSCILQRLKTLYLLFHSHSVSVHKLSFCINISDWLLQLLERVPHAHLHCMMGCVFVTDTEVCISWSSYQCICNILDKSLERKSFGRRIVSLASYMFLGKKIWIILIFEESSIKYARC